MKKKYTYIPKEDIESVMTWEGKEISGDKLLDGAYAKGKFADGGMMAKGGLPKGAKIKDYDGKALPSKVFGNVPATKTPIPYKGMAVIINGYNGYESTWDDGLLAAVVDGTAFKNGKPILLLKDEDGFYIMKKGARGSFKIYSDDLYAKGGETSDIKKIRKTIDVLESQGDEKSMMYAERLREQLYEMEPRVTRTQFEEEEFEYADGGEIKVGDIVKVSGKKAQVVGTFNEFFVVKFDNDAFGEYTYIISKDMINKDGGMMADGGITDQMREAKKIMGEKWDRMSKEEKVKATKYLIMKGEIEGDDEDYEYANGGMINTREWTIKPNNRYYRKFIVDREDYREITEHGVTESMEELDNGKYEIIISVTKAGKDYFEKNMGSKYAKGGRMDVKNREAMQKAAAIREAVKIAQLAYENGIKASDMSLEEYSMKVSQASGMSFGKAYIKLAYESMKSTGYAKGGYMASSFKNGGVSGRNRKRTLEEMAAEAVGTSTWFQLDKETQAGVIAELITEGVLPQRMAKGSKVSEDFSVTYKLADGKSVTEKYSNKDEMDEGIAMFYLNNDVLDAIINEAKPKEEKPAKKSLFDTGKAAPKVAKSKSTAPIVEVAGLEDEIGRYDELKAIIKNADAEKELIGGKIKEVAKEAYIETYVNMGKRPTSITIKSGDKDISYTVQDKYKLVNEDKETVLEQYEGLLGTDYTFTFDKEILDKTGANGEKIADIINDLIANSEDIPDEYKSKLVQVTKKTGVKSGTIERLLQYDNPAEIFAVIEPIEALK